MLEIQPLDELNQASVTALIRKLIAQKGEVIIKKALFSDDTEKPYGRKVLFQNNQIELLLTGWNPGHACWPHTHGECSEGIVSVLSGEGTFKIFPRLGDIDGKTRVLSTGNIIFVPCGEIHSMGNDGREPLVCLHTYWPPVSEMWIYNPNQTIGWRVSNGGAWKPEQQYIIEERKVEHAS